MRNKAQGTTRATPTSPAIVNGLPVGFVWKTTRYRVWTYDLWGNEEDGYTVNDRYKQELLEVTYREWQCCAACPGKGKAWKRDEQGQVPCTCVNTARETWNDLWARAEKASRRAGYLKGCHASTVDVDGEAGATLYFNHKGIPAFELCRETE